MKLGHRIRYINVSLEIICLTNRQNDSPRTNLQTHCHDTQQVARAYMGLAIQKSIPEYMIPVGNDPYNLPSIATLHEFPEMIQGHDPCGENPEATRSLLCHWYCEIQDNRRFRK